MEFVSKIDEKIKKLKEELEKMEKNKMFPISIKDDYITKEKISDNIDNLEKQKFTICVTGSIKTGKSTFLNSLFFKKDILPKFDTPYTAKLTFIEYPDNTNDKKENYFKVNFYSKEDWENVKKYKGIPEQIKISGERYGVYEDVIYSKDDTQHPLEELNRYVCVFQDEESEIANNTGMYTPFVKDVHIFINDKSIEKFRIVDTPGLNDANVINSQETKRFIRNAHALIYLLYNEGIEEDDTEFLKNIAIGTNKNSRIFVVNKIDDYTIDENENPIKSLNSVKDRVKRILGKDETVCGYSALSILALAKEKNKEILSNEDKDCLEKIKKIENFNPDPDHIEEEIKKKIYENAEFIRDNAAENLISSVYKQYIKNKEKEITDLNTKIKDSKKGTDELNEDIEKQKKLKKNLANFYKTKCTKVRRDIENICANFFVENIDNAINTMRKSISPKNYKNYRELETDLTNDICAELDNIFNDDKLKINLVSTKEKIEEEVNNKIIIGIKEILTNTEIDENNFILPPLKTEISFFEDIENIKRNFRKQMEDAMPSYWFTNYFQTTTDEAGKVINILFDGVDEKDEEEKTKFNNFHGLIDLINQKKVSTREKILKETDAMVNSVIGENNKSIDEKSEIKEQTKQERENNIKKYEQEIKNITEKIKEIEEYKDNFNK